jgi:S-methylmethionine-dependent homocysteine/selenocysteine methylase
MSYAPIANKLVSRQNIILDGGTGTDIQRRGATMSTSTWCADANLTHPDIVKTVHAAYFSAGAEIITANTYASSPFLLQGANRLDELEIIDQTALNLAREAVGDSVCIAGSMSTMRPMTSGSDRNNLSIAWSQKEARSLFARKARALKAAGSEMIMMEMMRDTDYALFACEAALQTNLPVWIGLSAEPAKGGGLQGWGRDDCAFEDIARTLTALKPDAMCIMHTAPNDVAPALEILRQYWNGPIGVYPESGYFKSPEWQFEATITPENLVGFAMVWQSMGVTIFGGCCGTGPEHVAALAQEFKT